MNKKTKVLISKLLNEVRRSPSGDLVLPLRKLLWKTITEEESGLMQKLILTSLDVACVNHASFMWSQKFKESQDIATMLSIALDAANGKIPEVTALNKRDEFYVETVENQDYQVDEYPIMFVGHAAANTIVTATADFIYDPSDLRNDRDLDPNAFEPSYLIASAFAGGLEENGNSELRRGFWEWYLSCAISQIV